MRGLLSYALLGCVSTLSVSSLSLSPVSLSSVSSLFQSTGYCMQSYSGHNMWRSQLSKRSDCICEGCEWKDNKRHLVDSHRRLDDIPVDLPHIFLLETAKDIRVTPENIAEWSKTYGLDLTHFLPSESTLNGENGGHFLVLASSEQVQGLPFIQGATPFPSQWKLSPLLSESLIDRTTAKVHKLDLTTLRVIFVPSPSIIDDDASTLETLTKKWTELLKDFSGVTAVMENKEYLVIKNISDEQLADIVLFMAEQPSSMYLEPGIVFTVSNYESSVLVQNGIGRFDMLQSQATPFLHSAGIMGDNQIISGADSGLDVNSCFFADNVDGVNQRMATTGTTYTNPNGRKVLQYVAFADGVAGEASDHGTHVFATVAGNVLAPSTGMPSYKTAFAGSFPVNSFNGVAPNAKIAFFDIGNPGAAYLKVPSDLNKSVFPPAYSAGARIHTNSWGSSTNSYTTDAQGMDTFSFNNQDFLILVAAGNDGENGAGSLGAPATAKNVLSVGAAMATDYTWDKIGGFVNNVAKSKTGIPSEDNMASFSSQGPCYDNRFKPDIASPGHMVFSCKSAVSGASCGVVRMSGTSMATPVTAGSMILTRQYFTDGFFPSGQKNAADGFIPMGALLRAIAINSGDAMTGVVAGINTQIPTGPNFYSGFGRVQLRNTLLINGVSTHNLAVLGDFNNMPAVQNGATSQKHIITVSGSQPVKITLVWHEPAATLGTAKALVNNLDLVVKDSNGVVQSVNGQAGRDTINNVEQVVLTTTGTYTIEVTGTSVTKPFTNPKTNVNMGQPYALVVAGSFTSTTLKSFLSPSIGPTVASTLPTSTATTKSSGSSGGGSNPTTVSGSGSANQQGTGGATGGEAGSQSAIPVTLLIIIGACVAGVLVIALVGYSFYRGRKSAPTILAAKKGGAGAARGASNVNKRQDIEFNNPVGPTKAPGGKPKPPGLPKGWQEVLDPASGQNYYFHEAKNLSQWERPTA